MQLTPKSESTASEPPPSAEPAQAKPYIMCEEAIGTWIQGNEGYELEILPVLDSSQETPNTDLSTTLSTTATQPAHKSEPTASEPPSSAEPSEAKPSAAYEEAIAKLIKASEGYEPTPLLDFTHETPNTHLSTIFQCTPTLKCRLTPMPPASLYILDFTDNEDHRLDKAAVDVYDLGVVGKEEALKVPPLGAHIPCGPLNRALYTVNTWNLVQLRDPTTGEVMNTITFTYAVAGHYGEPPIPRIEKGSQPVQCA